MTYKRKTIKACLELAKKYRKPQGLTFFCHTYCDLCIIYFNYKPIKCKGCFMDNNGVDTGCSDFKTYKRVTDILSVFNTFYPEDKKTSITFIRRAEFFERMAKELEKYPAKQFTPEGWKYFEISRNQ